MSTVFSTCHHFKYLFNINYLGNSGEVPQNSQGLVPFRVRVSTQKKGTGLFFLLRENRPVPFFPNDGKEFNTRGTAYHGKGRFDTYSFSLTYWSVNFSVIWYFWSIDSRFVISAISCLQKREQPGRFSGIYQRPYKNRSPNLKGRGYKSLERRPSFLSLGGVESKRPHPVVDHP